LPITGETVAQTALSRKVILRTSPYSCLSAQLRYGSSILRSGRGHKLLAPGRTSRPRTQPDHGQHVVIFLLRQPCRPLFPRNRKVRRQGGQQAIKRIASPISPRKLEDIPPAAAERFRPWAFIRSSTEASPMTGSESMTDADAA